MVEKTYNNGNVVTNSTSIVSLTLGILSILIPFLGLILGIAGVVVYRKARSEMYLTGEGGKGIAVSGLICSIVGILGQVLMLLAYLMFSSLVVF